MIKMYHLKKGFRAVLWFYLVSLIVLSLVGAYLGLRGRRVTYTTKPSQTFEEVSFTSQARDRLTLGGWFLPASSKQVAVIVHGWAGHRGRLLNLAEYLQRQNINVLTFDLRGGTGRNTYGEREAFDLAGAVEWLVTNKRFDRGNVTVVGASMGGAATINYAARETVGKLVLISPIVNLNTTKRKILMDRHYFLPQLYATGATFIERYVYGVKPTNPKDVFSSMVEPTLTLHGTADNLSPVSELYALQKQNQLVTNKEFVFVENGQHNFLDQDQSNNYPYSQVITNFIYR